MILLFAIYIIVALILIGGSIFLRGVVRKVLLSLTIMFVTLPVCFVVFIGVFKSEIQQGKFLQDFGPLLILIAPPDDIWVPLASQDIDPTKQEYNFHFKHKYVGNHIVDLSFRKLDSIEYPDNNLELQYIVFSGSKLVFFQSSKKGWPFWGGNNSGLTFVSYSVPQTLPVDQDLFVNIRIKGDINAFIKKYGVTRVIVRKGYDE